MIFQAASSDEEDERSSTTRSSAPPSRVLSEQHSSRPQSPLLFNGLATSSSRLTKPSTPISTNSHPTHICHVCKTINPGHDDELVICTSCHHHFHPTCLDGTSEMLAIIKTYSWQCIDCKSCAKCNQTHDEVRVVMVSVALIGRFFSQANMIFCDRCDRGYHTYCAGLESIPDGSWQCSACDPPPPLTPSSPVPIVKAKRGRPSGSR